MKHTDLKSISERYFAQWEARDPDAIEPAQATPTPVGARMTFDGIERLATGGHAWLNGLFVLGVNELSPDHMDHRMYRAL